MTVGPRTRYSPSLSDGGYISMSFSSKIFTSISGMNRPTKAVLSCSVKYNYEAMQLVSVIAHNCVNTNSLGRRSWRVCW